MKCNCWIEGGKSSRLYYCSIYYLKLSSNGMGNVCCLKTIIVIILLLLLLLLLIVSHTIRKQSANEKWWPTKRPRSFEKDAEVATDKSICNQKPWQSLDLILIRPPFGKYPFSMGDEDCGEINSRQAGGWLFLPPQMARQLQVIIRPELPEWNAPSHGGHNSIISIVFNCWLMLFLIFPTLFQLL